MGDKPAQVTADTIKSLRLIESVLFDVLNEIEELNPGADLTGPRRELLAAMGIFK